MNKQTITAQNAENDFVISASAVPDGWKLVPVVPTHEMKRAGLAERHDDLSQSIYQAMLAAAPTPPSAQAGEEVAPAAWRIDWPAAHHCSVGGQRWCGADAEERKNLLVSFGATAVPLFTQPSAIRSAGLDEREAFEAAWIDIGGMRMEDYDLSQAVNGNYGDDEVQAAWEIWQARAALSPTAAEVRREATALRRLVGSVDNYDDHELRQLIKDIGHEALQSGIAAEGAEG